MSEKQKQPVFFTREELESKGYDADNHPLYVGNALKRLEARKQAERDAEIDARAARLEAQGISPEARRDGVILGATAMEHTIDAQSLRPISTQYSPEDK